MDKKHILYMFKIYTKLAFGTATPALKAFILGSLLK